MTILAVCTGKWLVYERVKMNLTVRNEGVMTPDVLSDLTERTIRLFVFCAKCIERGVRVIPHNDERPELEQSPDEMLGIVGFEVEPHVTVFGDVYAGHTLTIHSHYRAQLCLDVFWARFDALTRLGIGDGEPNESEAKPEVTSGNGDTAQVGGGELPDGVLIGKMNPSSTKVYYENGQTVALPVKKIVLAYREGWYYEFWTGLGNNQYPGVKVFKTKKGSDENSDAYKAMKEVIEGLQLDPDKRKSVEGDWWIIGNINHVEKDGAVKEFFNAIELRAK